MTRLITLLVAVAAGAALAQSDSPNGQAPKSSKSSKVERTSIVIFTPGEAITGEADSPNGVIVETVQRPTFPSFFKVRENFDDKMRESVNDL